MVLGAVTGITEGQILSPGLWRPAARSLYRTQQRRWRPLAQPDLMVDCIDSFGLVARRAAPLVSPAELVTLKGNPGVEIKAAFAGIIGEQSRPR